MTYLVCRFFTTHRMTPNGLSEFFVRKGVSCSVDVSEPQSEREGFVIEGQAYLGVSLTSWEVCVQKVSFFVDIFSVVPAPNLRLSFFELYRLLQNAKFSDTFDVEGYLANEDATRRKVNEVAPDGEPTGFVIEITGVSLEEASLISLLVDGFSESSDVFYFSNILAWTENSTRETDR